MKSKEQLMQEILAQKNTKPTLVNLDSTSEVAVWLLWIEVIAYILETQTVFFDELQADVNQLINQNIQGTPIWYVTIAKKFQLGDAIEQLPKNEPYSNIDNNKRIVTLASCVEQGNALYIKVAKGNPVNPLPLSESELTQFATYMGKVKFAGTPLFCISLPADLLTISATIYYDGQYTLSEVETSVQTAIENFLFQIPFNGIFYKNGLTDFIDDIPSIVNIDQDNAIFEVTQGETIIIGTKHQTIAGYMRFDSSNSNITYIAT